MNIAVLIREKVDPVGNPIFSEDSKKISDLNKIITIDESDLSAMKTAVMIKEHVPKTTIDVFYIGNNRYLLRSVLALGADDAQLIKLEDDKHMFEMIPHVFQIISEKNYDFFLTGQQGAGANGIGATIASMAGATLITSVILLEKVKDGTGIATRTLGRGQRQVVSLTLPALVTCDRTMKIKGNSSIPNLLKSSKMKIKEHDLKILNKSERIVLQTPSPRPKKIFMPDSKAGATSRLKQILSGGVKQRTMDRLEGESKEIAQQFISFLKKENVISK